jgi:hypothetical protein
MTLLFDSAMSLAVIIANTTRTYQGALGSHRPFKTMVSNASTELSAMALCLAGSVATIMAGGPNAQRISLTCVHPTMDARVVRTIAALLLVLGASASVVCL